MGSNNDVNENERDAQNNANNIRNAADVAIASKHPIAMVAGGAVKVADRLTGGRASQKIGSAASRLNRHSPMGNMVQDASNKLSESGASDAIGTMASMDNGTQSNNPNGTDVGQEKLQESFAKRAGNFFKNRKKKKSSDEESSSDSNDNSQNDSGNLDDDTLSDEEDEKAKIRKKKIVKLVFSIIGAVLPLFLLLVFVVVIVSVISSVFPLLANIFSDYFKEVNAFAVYERKYYDRLDLINNTQSGTYGILCNNPEKGITGNKFDTNYFHVALMYKYYIMDGEIEVNEDENVDQKQYEELQRALENLDKNFETFLLSDSSEKISENCNISYEKDGNLYKFLSDNLYSYYSAEIGKRSRETGISGDAAYNEILDEIFDLAESISDTAAQQYDAVPSDLAINDVDENKSILVKDYLTGVIYSNVDKSLLTNSEKLKAYTVIYTTNILSKNKISINTQSISSKSLDNFNYCDPNSNCNGKGAISDIVKNTINNSIESVYGNVLVNSSGDYDTLDINKLYDADGSDFTTILSNAYQGYTIRNAKEDVYDNGINYGNEMVLTPVTFYEQTNYKSSFCGLKDETIATSGCGTTSMAIIVSTYENNKKYDPVYMAEEARKGRYCSRGSGTYAGFFRYEAKALKYNHLSVKKTSDVNKLNIVTSHLRKGHLIIVHVGKGQFTNGGHYMVLGGIDPATKSVYVYDPYNKLNSKYKKSGSGWYKFNDILKQTKPAPTYTAFQIIWKE